MPKYPKNFKDAGYWVSGRKRPLTGSTSATSYFLGIVCEANPNATIFQLREMLTDRSKFIFNPEAVAVLDAHIKAGYGNHIPNWRY